jgi:hypothetical protein
MLPPVNPRLHIPRDPSRGVLLVCEEMGSSLWFLASLFENMPRARDSGHPGRPRKTVLPDAAFREANGVGVATNKRFRS